VAGRREVGDLVVAPETLPSEAGLGLCGWTYHTCRPGLGSEELSVVAVSDLRTVLREAKKGSYYWGYVVGLWHINRGVCSVSRVVT
jgi:hypothetical protein